MLLSIFGVGGVGGCLWAYMQARKLEELKLDNDRLRLAHTKQFEKEFQLYEKLWEKLWALNAAARQLGDDTVRKFGSVVTGEDEVAKSQEHVKACLTPVMEITEWNAPFFHASIYTELSAFVEMCKRAWLDDQYPALATLNREVGRKLYRVVDVT